MPFYSPGITVLSLTTCAHAHSHSAFLALMPKAKCGYLPVTISVGFLLSETIFKFTYPKRK